MSDNCKITLEEVQRIAHLARLEINPQEADRLSDQLSATADYIDVLKELNTDDVASTAQVNHKKNALREDVITPSLSQSESLSQGPDCYDGYFKTKATIKK